MVVHVLDLFLDEAVQALAVGPVGEPAHNAQSVRPLVPGEQLLDRRRDPAPAPLRRRTVLRLPPASLQRPAETEEGVVMETLWFTCEVTLWSKTPPTASGESAPAWSGPEHFLSERFLSRRRAPAAAAPSLTASQTRRRRSWTSPPADKQMKNISDLFHYKSDLIDFFFIFFSKKLILIFKKWVLSQ